MRCFACGGPYHPATGHLFQIDIAYCGACYRPFLQWFKGRMNMVCRKHRFYDAAATSIRPRSEAEIMQLSESCDVGSIPTEDAKAR